MRHYPFYYDVTNPATMISLNFPINISLLTTTDPTNAMTSITLLPLYYDVVTASTMAPLPPQL